MPFWTVIYEHGYLPLLAALTLATFRWGDATVRRVALATLILMAIQTAFPRSYRTVEWSAVATDLPLLIVLLTLSVKQPRWWLLPIAAIQLLQITGHVARMIDPSVSRLAYAILQGGGAYLQLILLSIGLMLSTRKPPTQPQPVTGSPVDTTKVTAPPSSTR